MSKASKSLIYRIKRYITYDLREIIVPSSLPNPPGYVPPPSRTWRQRWTVLNAAIRGYIDSWNPKIVDAELRRLRGEPEPDESEVPATHRDSDELKLLADEFGQAARGGAKSLVPFLQHIYNTRAAAYRDAVKQFIAGYKEGFQEAQEEGGPEAALGSKEPRREDAQSEKGELGRSDKDKDSPTSPSPAQKKPP